MKSCACLVLLVGYCLPALGSEACYLGNDFSNSCSSVTSDAASAIQIDLDTRGGRSNAGPEAIGIVKEESKTMRLVQTLTNYNDIEYTGKFSLGGQVLHCIFDSASFDLLVFSVHCESGDCAENRRFYNPKASAKHEQLPWRRLHSFGSGDVQSNMATDELTLGLMKFQHAAIWESQNIDLPSLRNGHFEAVFGLGHPRKPARELKEFVKEDDDLLAECNTSKYACPLWLRNQAESDRDFLRAVELHPPFLESMGVRRFSFCLRLGRGAAGYLVWNDFNPIKWRGGLFQEMQVTGKLSWSMDITDVHIDAGVYSGKEAAFCRSQRCAGMLDTGTSLLTAPSAVVMEFHRMLSLRNGSCTNLTGFPDLVFTLDNSVIRMPPQSYIGVFDSELPAELRPYFPQLTKLGKERSAGSCQLLMMGINALSMNDRPLWIVGMPFFREYYSTFDFGSDRNYDTRNVYISPSDGQCNHPNSMTYNLLARSEPDVQRVDLSRVHVPTWIRRAHKMGRIRL